MRLPARWLVVMTCFLIASKAVAAFGDPLARPTSPEAGDHLDRGNNLYNIGSFDDAIGEYKAGALVEPAPVFDYNLGQANRQLGKYREALWHYDRFLNKGQPAGELRDAVIAFMAEMRTHLENKAQTMPPREPAPTDTSSSSTPSVASAPTAAPLQQANTATADESDGRDWLGWSLTGSGLVALGASGVLFYRASQLNSQGDSEPDMQARNSFYDEANNRKLAGAIVGIGGVVLTTVGILRLTLHHRSPPSQTALNVGLSNHGLFVAGSF
jgi:tetratricopeptide (TPR) repeat protein